MRATKKIINLNHLSKNLSYIRARVKTAKIVAVVKADAYGCGSEDSYQSLEAADLFAVASIEEAIVLRNAGAKKPILLLEGVFEPSELKVCLKENFYISVGNLHQLSWLLELPEKIAKVWLKFDTGMGRLGFFADEIDEIITKLRTRYLDSELVLMTHFADADGNKDYTYKQVELFDQVAKNYPNIEQSMANSAATLDYPETHRDYVRPGIALYGASPFAFNDTRQFDLLAVTTLLTAVINVKFFKKDQSIGYGQSYQMQSDGYVAICAIGYADGYLRSILTGSPIMIVGKRYTVIGRVSMDMIAVLVDKNIQVGDPVECFGENLLVEELSYFAQTIPYQLLTTITKRPKKEMIPKWQK